MLTWYDLNLEVQFRGKFLFLLPYLYFTLLERFICGVNNRFNLHTLLYQKINTSVCRGQHSCVSVLLKRTMYYPRIQLLTRKEKIYSRFQELNFLENPNFPTRNPGSLNFLVGIPDPNFHKKSLYSLIDTAIEQSFDRNFFQKSFSYQGIRINSLQSFFERDVPVFHHVVCCKHFGVIHTFHIFEGVRDK